MVGDRHLWGAGCVGDLLQRLLQPAFTDVAPRAGDVGPHIDADVRGKGAISHGDSHGRNETALEAGVRIHLRTITGQVARPRGRKAISHPEPGTRQGRDSGVDWRRTPERAGLALALTEC